MEYIKVYDKGKKWHGMRVPVPENRKPDREFFVFEPIEVEEEGTTETIYRHRTIELQLWKIKVSRRSGRVTWVYRYTSEAAFPEI